MSQAQVAAAPKAAGKWQSEIIVFCCNFCAYAAADLGGRTAHANTRPTCAWCTCPAPARVALEHILAAFEKGNRTVC